MTNTESIFDLSFVDNRGERVSLSDFAGKVLLVVNTASKCGFTGQYDGLQKLHEELADRGLVVLGFPCDQFAHQEPGDDSQIAEFCRVNFGVTFPLSTKVDVNGKDTDPVLAFVKERTRGRLGSAVKWNFTKFLVAPDGQTVRRFAPTVDPADLRADVETLLATVVR
jgi:glutathione peroxidase